MKFLKETAKKFSIIKELFEFLMKRKKWWLMPIVLVLILVAVLIILAESSAVGPFVYTLF